MTARILYLGDTALEGPAAYLAGLMTDRGWTFDYLASDQAVTIDVLNEARQLVILSDYPAAMMSQRVAEQLVGQVQQGTGLLMIGGWESFKGAGGDWEATPIAPMLPVAIAATDDRRNCDHPVLLDAVVEHPITANLPWNSRPPMIGGYNRFLADSEGRVLVEAQHFAVNHGPDGFHFAETEREPLLVVGQYGAGRTAALAHDLAPHWVGPLVDWGPERVTAKAPHAGEVEVGNCYAQYVQQLLVWVGKL